MGRQKRKNNSPLLKETGKTPRTGQDSDEGEDGSANQAGPVDEADVISDLKEFIRTENERSNRALTEEIRRHNDERMTALETSLSFALTTSETLAKRLSAAEQRARQAEQDFFNCASRLVAVEEQLDQIQQRECHDWLIFSGPAIARLPRSGRDQDASQLLRDMVRSLMGYDMDAGQLGAVHREERQIRVHFNSVSAGSDRHFLVRNKTRLRGTGLYIRERLTPYRQRIFNDMLQLKRSRQISTVFTKEGTVFVVVDRGDRPRPVRSEAAVERLVQLLSERTAGPQSGAQARQPQQHSPGGTDAPSAMSRNTHSPGTEGAEIAADTGCSPRAATRQGPSPPGRAPGGRPEVEDSTGGVHRRPVDPVSAADRELSRPRHGPVPGGQGMPASSAGPVGSDSVDGQPASGGPADLRDGRWTAPGGSRHADGGDGDPGGQGGISGVTGNLESAAFREEGRSREMLGRVTDGPRRRFGGDIRQFVSTNTVHRKRD